jgi:hypothetical protein
MGITKRTGVAGIAVWDHGEYTRDGRHYSSLSGGVNFYRDDLRYKLREYRFIPDGLELQKESLYQFENNSWEKTGDFYTIPDFLPFLVRNDFLSLHLRAMACDITSLQESNRQWALGETTAGIDFGWSLFADALTLHPGALNEYLNRDRQLGIQVDWDYAIRVHRRREELLTESFREIVRHFIHGIVPFELSLESERRRHGDRQSSSLGAILTEYRARWKNPVSELEQDERGLLVEIIDEIRRLNLPIHYIRHLMNPDRGMHLCLENVEPYNFLINLPQQHRFWWQQLVEIYADESRRQNLPADFFHKYMPMMVVDTNHYLNSQFILREHPELEWIYGPCFQDVHRPFVRLPGDYHDDEPLINRVVRNHNPQILFYHVAGAVRNDWLLTHERIQPFRTHVATTEDETGRPIFRYGLANFDSAREINLEEVIQVIGNDQVFILEVFNASSECIKNSQENVKSFLNYVGSMRKLFHTRLIRDRHYQVKQQADPGTWEIDSMGFFIKSHPREHYLGGGVGFDQLKFFRFDESSEFGYRIFATMTENQEIWVNPGP